MTTREKDQTELDAFAETPPEGGSDLVPEMVAALKFCRDYLSKKSQESCNNMKRAICGDEYHAYIDEAASIDAVLEPVCAALGLTDFNDIHRARGLAALKRALRTALAPILARRPAPEKTRTRKRRRARAGP